MSQHVPDRDRPVQAPSPAGSSPAASPQDPAQAPPQTVEATDAPASLVRESEVTAEQIAVRAYEIWQTRGRPEGTAQEDWLEAERQLRSRPADQQKDSIPLDPAPAATVARR